MQEKEAKEIAAAVLDHRRPLSVAEAARSLHVCDQTVRNLFDAARLDGYRVGRKRIIYADSVDEFKMSNSNHRAAPAPAEPVAQPEPERKPLPTPKRRGVRTFDRHRGR